MGDREQSPRVLVIDNYDSFTYNLVQLPRRAGGGAEVVRNDKETVAALLDRRPDSAGDLPRAVHPAGRRRIDRGGGAFPKAGIPTLGVCLGHQSLVEAFGGRTIRGEPIHGKDAAIEHDGKGVLRGLESPLRAGRYHSLVADPELPDQLELTATLGDVVMGVRHRELPAEGVQFHPESVLTPRGKDILGNFLAR